MKQGPPGTMAAWATAALRGAVYEDENSLSTASFSRPSTVIDYAELKRAALEELYSTAIAEKKAVLVEQDNDEFKLIDLQKLSKEDRDILAKRFFPDGRYEADMVKKIRERIERQAGHRVAGCWRRVFRSENLA